MAAADIGVRKKPGERLFYFLMEREGMIGNGERRRTEDEGERAGMIVCSELSVVANTFTCI